jgi:hypothetical protein
MYDSGKIIAGLVIFVLLITFPIWYNKLGTVSAAPAQDPNLAFMAPMLEGYPLANGQVHPPADAMRAIHMDILQNIHAGVTGYDPQKDGKKPQMSCVSCHSSGQQFCDSCHNYVSVKPANCTDCHQE